MPERITRKDKTKTKNIGRPYIQYVSLLIISVIISSLTAMLFILITASSVAAAVSFICAAVLCLLPAFVCKCYIVFRRLRIHTEAIVICIVGFLLSLPLACSYYISHGYDLRVYRYMKQTPADIYYFGGYEQFCEDYADAADFMRQMQTAPASIVLEDMSEEKLSSLSADEIKTINNESLWDYCGFNDILGGTAEETERSMEKSAELDAYEFTFSYRPLHAKTTGYLLTHPSLLIEEISDPSQLCIRPVTLIFFFAVQLIAYRVIIFNFEVDKNRELRFVIRRRRSSERQRAE